MQWFSGLGAGGQKKNKCMSSLRLIHKESGVKALATEERSPEANKKLALRRLSEHPKFRAWLEMKLNEIESGQTIEDKVNEEMDNKNLKFEVKDEITDKWIEIKESEIKN